MIDSRTLGSFSQEASMQTTCLLNLYKLCFSLAILLFGLFLYNPTLAGGPEYKPTISGFYLYANIGGTTYQRVSNIPITFELPGVFANNSLLDTDARDAFSFTYGGGMGWMFNRIFRLDVTYTYLRYPLNINGVVIASTLGANAQDTSFGIARASSEV